MITIRKNITLSIIALFIIVSPIYALQQTSGALTINIIEGESGFAGYGLKNEENQTVVVKLSADGSIKDYIEYPKELTLKSGEFYNLNITTNATANYNGSRTLNGTIYALKEGEQGGQVQLNIRLGKRISLNITEPMATIQSDTQKTIPGLGGIIITSIVIIVAVVMHRKMKETKYKIKGKEVENK